MQEDNIYLLEMSLRLSFYTNRVTLFHNALWNATGIDIYYNYRIHNVGAAMALLEQGEYSKSVKSVRFDDIYKHRHRWAGGSGGSGGSSSSISSNLGSSGDNEGGIEDIDRFGVDFLMSVLQSNATVASSSSSSTTTKSEIVDNGDIITKDILFLKMDIEGSETNALEGMALLISHQKITHVVIEVSTEKERGCSDT